MVSVDGGEIIAMQAEFGQAVELLSTFDGWCQAIELLSTFDGWCQAVELLSTFDGWCQAVEFFLLLMADVRQ